jgi:DNA-binding transcriptional regulator YhcF (GntR family)
MLLRVDPSSSVGLADQIAAQVRGRLASGELAAGDRLPPARTLAEGLDVNMHTVLRAYAALRDDGLVELRRGRGARVRDTAGDGVAARHGAQLRTQIEDLVARARVLGLTEEQLFDRIRKVMS